MWNGIAMQSKVLICPLDWGLGHVARSTALAANILAQNCIVNWAAPKSLHLFILEHFPDAVIFPLPAYNVRYSAGSSQIPSMIRQFPKFRKTISAENKAIEQLIQVHDFDAIISDHRYGCFHKSVKSIFLAHQLQVLLPISLNWFQPFLNKAHQHQLRFFDEIWIPDFPNQALSGNLSTLKTKALQRFIGPQSRFDFDWKMQLVSFPFDIKQLNTIVIASGPEPHKSMFIEEVKNRFKTNNEHNLIVSGQLGETHFEKLSERLWQVNHLNTESLKAVFQHTQKVICRSGYSSIMDLAGLNKKAEFIPTPGQTEQIYLAALHQTEK